MDRRHFIRAGLGTAVVAGVVGNTRVTDNAGQSFAAESTDGETLKFSVFADIHHMPGSFYSRTPEHLVQIQDRAQKEKCDLIIHAGDFCHNPPKWKDFVDLYNNFAIPSYHCLGNHDQDGCAWEETLECYKMTDGHYYFDKKGFRFIVFDPCYILLDGKYVHYTKSNYYKYGAFLDNVPPEQVEWMKDAIFNSPNPCILVSHQSIEREANGIKNRDVLRAMIDEANRRFPGRVRLVVNGHYHRDSIRVWDNVVYFDLNSASHDWLGGHACKGLFPAELCKTYSQLENTVVFNDPIHAVVTIKPDGYIKIDGMKSTMFMGVDRAKAKAPIYDSMGRPAVPRVSSATMRMIYS